MLEKILEKAYRLQQSCSQLFLDSNSVLFRSETQSIISSRHERVTESLDRRTITSVSSVESFVSAQAEVRFVFFFLVLNYNGIVLVNPEIVMCQLFIPAIFS